MSSDQFWFEAKECDLTGSGDVYNEKAGSIEDMKKMIVEKGWSCVTIAKDGHAWFKKFHYSLNATHLHKNEHCVSTWIYNPNGHKLGKQTTEIDTSCWV